MKSRETPPASVAHLQGVDPTQRFSQRVADYVRYRPGYPQAVIDALVDHIGLKPEWIVADVGSGTGLLAELFLRFGNFVLAVEPNREMREAGREYLKPYPHCRHLDGRAEALPLADQSVDLLTAGQAFHWFDRARARKEFLRVLRPGGYCALVWNSRKTTGDDFAAAYEAFLKRFAIDYDRVNHQKLTGADFDAFFAEYTVLAFPNQQILDFAGLLGRVRSSSYMPTRGHPRFAAMRDALQALFEAHAQAGRVRLEYDCCLYVGRLRREEK